MNLMGALDGSTTVINGYASINGLKMYYEIEEPAILTYTFLPLSDLWG